MKTSSFSTDWGELMLQWTLIVCGIICSLYALATLTVCMYRKRQGSKYTVNCWFCNTTTKVPYSTRNSWTCPSCKQYNGFTKDGGYNKRIIAQFIEALNPALTRRGLATKKNLAPLNGTTTENGLCIQCNLNQELKIFQLASFVPSSEAKFDKELEIEKRRLEKMYDLCSSCQAVLVAKLAKVMKRTTTEDSLSIVINQRIEMKTNKRTAPISLPQFRLNGIDFDTQSSANSSNASFYSTTSYISDKDTRASSSLTMDFSEDVSNNEFDEINSPITKLHKLRIGSTPKKSMRAPEVCINSSRYCIGNNQCFMGQLPPTTRTPLWKDYPLVYNTNNSSFGRPMAQQSSSSFTNYRSSYKNSLSPSYYESRPSSLCYGNLHNNYYRSSSVANIFGGKSCLSPPKLSYGSSSSSNLCMNNHAAVNTTTFGLYYQNNYVPAAPSPSSEIFYNQFGNSPHYLNSNPISRTSSQSSGFISQGLHTPSPPPPLTTPKSSITSSIRDNLSFSAEPCVGGTTTTSLHKNMNTFFGDKNMSPGFTHGLESEMCLRFDRNRDTPTKITRGRKNEWSRFGPSPTKHKDSTCGSHCNARRRGNKKCQLKHIDYSSDEDNDSIPDSCNSFATARNDSFLRKETSTRSNTTTPEVLCNPSINGQKDRRYFTGKKLLYYTIIITSFLLNILFMAWLIFGNDNETIVNLVNSVNQSSMIFYKEYIKPYYCLEWLRHVSNNFTHCVRKNVFF